MPRPLHAKIAFIGFLPASAALAPSQTTVYAIAARQPTRQVDPSKRGGHFLQSGDQPDSQPAFLTRTRKGRGFQPRR